MRLWVLNRRIMTATFLVAVFLDESGVHASLTKSAKTRPSGLASSRTSTVLVVPLQPMSALTVLTVRAASIEDYEVIHRQEIARLPRVARIETAFALREVVNRSVPPRLLG